MVFRALLFFFLASIGLSKPAVAAGFIGIETENSATVITLNTGTVPAHKVFFLENPERLVVDVPLAKVPTVYVPNDYAGDLVAGVRAGRFNPQTVRIVFDLNVACTLVTKTLDDGVLTISIAAVKGAPRKERLVDVPVKPKKPEKPLVVIDPGHGGDDPGAIGPKDSQEKDIVLAFAKALEQSLLATGKYRVKLTRESDVFIPLRGRVKIARDAKAGIFISLHADSAPGADARGLSVYTLSEKASDAETEKLAASENKVDILGGMDLSHEREDVADILISLAQRETRNQSGMLADLLTMTLSKRVKLLPNTHRFAGFAVLKAPDIPSVLIETGFISHPAEEKLLKTKDYRTRLIGGITDGVNRYFEKQAALNKAN